MRTNKAGVELVKHHEGLQLKAYKCPAGVWTIGYGHTGDVKEGDVITAHQAEAILDVDLDTAERIVERECPGLNENQFSAVVSFVFNVGPGKKGVRSGFVTLKDGSPSTMLKYLRAGRPDLAAGEFRWWVNGGGKVQPGLIARRAAERDLFETPVRVGAV